MDYLIPNSGLNGTVWAFTVETITMLQYSERHIGMMGNNLFFSYPVKSWHFNIMRKLRGNIWRLTMACNDCSGVSNKF